jgi:hypothetical protein
MIELGEAWMIFMTVLMLRTWWKVERCKHCSLPSKRVDPIGGG